MKNSYENPLITVLIPAYNSSDYIEETINSVLSQTYKNVELIVIDDESTDNTLDILEKLSKADKRISYFQIKHSGRPAIPFNHGLRKAKGKYVAFLGSDDLWHKEKLADQVRYLEKNPSKVLVYSLSITFGKVNIFSPNYEMLPLPFRAAKTRTDLINIGNTVPASSVLARLDVVMKAGCHDEDPELMLEDYHLWLKMSEYGDMGFIPKIHLYYRVHDKQFSGDWETKRKRLKYLAEKTGLPLPEYKEFRNRGLVILMVRNFFHFGIYLIFSLYTSICIIPRSRRIVKSFLK